MDMHEVTKWAFRLAPIVGLIIYKIISHHIKTSKKGGTISKESAAESLENFMPDIENLSKNSIQLIKSEYEMFTRIGGQPSGSDAFEWPAWNGKSLSFIAQIKFSEINNEGYLADIPKRGLLYIFYDQDQSTWGFDPNDIDSWRVYYFEDETVPLKVIPYPEDIEESTMYPVKYLKAKKIKTYPNWEDERIIALKMSDEQSNLFAGFRSSFFNGYPQHQVGGYPNPIQSPEMYNECQLVSNGLYCGDSTGYEDPRAEALLKDAKDWTLLLQIDTDDDVSMMWGDVGTLYFWIRKDDLKENRFKNVWMILQCG